MACHDVVLSHQRSLEYITNVKKAPKKIFGIAAFILNMRLPLPCKRRDYLPSPACLRISVSGKDDEQATGRVS